MAARNPDITLTRNAGWSQSLTLFTDKARTLPLDLTGYTVKAQLRATESSTSAKLADITATVAAPATVGRIDLALTQATIAAITAAEGWFDLLLVPSVGDPHRLCYGKMIIADGETVWP